MIWISFVIWILLRQEMYDRNKTKIKMEINKALQNVNSILLPSSEAKSLLEQSSKDIQFEKNDKVHCNLCLNLETIKDEEDGREFIIS